MRIGVAQITTGGDPQANLELVRHHTARAAQQGAELVVFPEATMCAFGHPLGPVAEPVDGPWSDGVRRIAAEHAVTVVAGMFTPGDGGRVRNTLVAHGPAGSVHYDKIHLFDAFGFAESDTVTPGSRPVLLDVAGTRVGLSTCYDVRFPALYRRLATDGAELVVVSASWGAGPGKVEQWRLLTRARALDATTVVVACGQADPAAAGVTAVDGAPTGVGYSAVVSPTGETLGELGPQPGLLVVDVDTAAVDRARAVLPVLANARPLD